MSLSLKVPTIGDFTSISFEADSAAAEAAVAAMAGALATNEWDPACIGMGGTGCMTPRMTDVLLMRIFIPLSDEISIESTLDSSIMSTSFLT